MCLVIVLPPWRAVGGSVVLPGFLGVLGLPFVVDFGDVTGVAIHVVSDSLPTTVGKIDVVRSLRIVPIPGLLLSEIVVVFVNLPIEFVLGVFVGPFFVGFGSPVGLRRAVAVGTFVSHGGESSESQQQNNLEKQGKNNRIIRIQN